MVIIEQHLYTNNNLFIFKNDRTNKVYSCIEADTISNALNKLREELFHATNEIRKNILANFICKLQLQDIDSIKDYRI